MSYTHKQRVVEWDFFHSKTGQVVESLRLTYSEASRHARQQGLVLRRTVEGMSNEAFLERARNQEKFGGGWRYGGY